MKISSSVVGTLAVLLAVFAPGPAALSQDEAGNAANATFSQEQLDQLVAPIALYPDELVAQIFAAATYPLEVVQADRWVKANKSLEGDALAKALESQTWDPSVKSLVNFPQVLDMMNEKLDWTEQLGDAFLAQEKDVMDAVQRLRAKAQSAGNLSSNEQQTVTVEPATNVIVVQPASPTVVYVPTYNPTVVYGAWPYPSYPPYYYQPPGYVATAGISFAAGVAIGAAWGYAWNGCNWHGGNVDVNVNRNVNVNNNINRSAYAAKYQKTGGTWQHDPAHRSGVPYRGQATAAKYNRASSPQGAASREAYRGRTQETGAGTRAPGTGTAAGRAQGATTGAGRTQGAGAAGTAGGGRAATTSSGRGARRRVFRNDERQPGEGLQLPR